MAATDLSSVAAALVPYLNAVDAATLRLTCRACRAYVDGALTQLRPFALPNGGFHRLAVPPHFVYHEAIKWSPGASKLHSPFQDGGFQQLALCAPGLRSLEVQCLAKGCLDFKCLQGMSQLAALTLLEFPFSGAAALAGVACCKCLQSLRLQSFEESLIVSHLSSLKQLSTLASLSLEPRSFQRATHSKWRGLSALGCMTALTELQLVYTDEMPGHGTEPPDAADNAWDPSSRGFDAVATQALSDCLGHLTGLRALSIRGLHAVPKSVGALRGLRRLSLEEMSVMHRADVAALAGLSQLTSLTLLWDTAAAAKHHAPNAPNDQYHGNEAAVNGDAADADGGVAQGRGMGDRSSGGGRDGSSGMGMLAPLTALQALRELVFGVEDAGIGRPHGHSLHPKCHHTIAYVCGEQLEHMSRLQGLTHLSVEPRGWQSCCMTAHYTAANQAVADLCTPLAHVAPWLTATSTGQAARQNQAGPSALIASGGAQQGPGHFARASSLPALSTCGSKGSRAAAPCAASAGETPGASMFVNHPELGSFLVAWPLCTVLHMAPCMGKLPAGERALVHQLLRRAVIGQGLVEGGSMGAMFAHLQLAQQRSSLPASAVLPRLAAAGACLRRVDLTMDKHWSQKAMGQLGELQALPGLQALRLDCSRLEAPEALWTGLAALTRLRWLSLRWFDALPVGKALAPLVQLEALQLRDMGHLPELGGFVAALSGMRRLRYLGLEGCLLDGADDLLGGLWGLLAGDRYSLAWIELTLTRQPMLQLLASLMGSFFLGSLLHAPRWPEMMLTFLLAVTLGGLLAAATALVLVPMLLGWGPGARLHEQLAPIRQLRYLSLRRSNFSSPSPSSLSLSTPRRRPNSLLGLARCLPDLRFLDAMWLNADPSELLALARLPGLHYLALQHSQLGPRWQWQLGGGGAVVVEATGGLEGVIEREVMGQGF